MLLISLTVDHGQRADSLSHGNARIGWFSGDAKRLESNRTWDRSCGCRFGKHLFGLSSVQDHSGIELRRLGFI